MPRRVAVKHAPQGDMVNDYERDQLIADDLREIVKDDGTTSVGHIVLRNERQHLYYLRLIEHEMPKLVGKSPFSLITHC